MRENVKHDIEVNAILWATWEKTKQNKKKTDRVCIEYNSHKIVKSNADMLNLYETKRKMQLKIRSVECNANDLFKERTINRYVMKMICS